jgi:hypothetical protein
VALGYDWYLIKSLHHYLAAAPNHHPIKIIAALLLFFSLQAPKFPTASPSDMHVNMGF